MMMQVNPPLLVIAALPESFNLSELEFSGNQKNQTVINQVKFQELQIVEVVLNGMAFILTHYTAEETRENFGIAQLETIFSERPKEKAASIGLTFGENLTSGKHVPAINQALLKLAAMVGESVSASHIAWLPAKQNVDFNYFLEAVDEYVAGGPMPALVQIKVEEKGNGLFVTTGLEYFSGQEIHLQAPAGFPATEAIKRMVRISHDIATNGKIDNDIDTAGMVAGEQISFRTNANGSRVLVEITLEDASLQH